MIMKYSHASLTPFHPSVHASAQTFLLNQTAPDPSSLSLRSNQFSVAPSVSTGTCPIWNSSATTIQNGVLTTDTCNNRPGKWLNRTTKAEYWLHQDNQGMLRGIQLHDNKAEESQVQQEYK